MSNEEIRAFVKRRSLGHDFAPIGARFSEESEDVIIQLLKADGLPANQRESIIWGLRDAYDDLHRRLVTIPRTSTDPFETDSYTRWCRIIDAAAPMELEAFANSFFSLLVDGTSINAPAAVATAAARACMTYHQPNTNLSLWLKALDRQELSAYAFSAILDIDPTSSIVLHSLVILWKRQVASSWPVDCAFLTRKAIRQLGPMGMSFCRKLIDQLRQSPDLWPLIQSELERREWSRAWLLQWRESAVYPKGRKSVLEIFRDLITVGCYRGHPPIPKQAVFNLTKGHGRTPQEARPLVSRNIMSLFYSEEFIGRPRHDAAVGSVQKSARQGRLVWKRIPAKKIEQLRRDIGSAGQRT